MNAPAPFVVFCLPRSRSYWLSQFLTYRDWSCAHDEAKHVRSLDDVKAWLAIECVGGVETGAAPWWRTLLAYRSDARVVVVRRPVGEVVDSIMATNAAFDRQAVSAAMRKLGAKLDQIAVRVPNAMVVEFADLEREAVCANVFEHCLPYAHDPAWWAALAPVNLQKPMAEMVRYAAAYGPALKRVGLAAKRETLARWAKRPVECADGMIIAREPFDTFLADGKALFAEHSIAVGEAPDSYAQKNIPLMRKLDDLGNLLVTTARCNGRMFGYLMTVIGPSLESERGTAAVNTTLYASPLFPGLGMKLHRAAIAACSDRGIDEMFFRAGGRGDGPRISSLFRRIGAEPNGDLYRLSLGSH